ncbi:MAG: OsmC family protein [Anaerolineales bacterium]
MEQPDYLKTIRARGKWLGGRVNDLYVRDFPVMRSDEPPHNEGTNTGPTPLEITLASLCA